MTRRQQITADYLGGLTVTQLSEKYGRTKGGLQSDLRAWGVTLSPEERRRRRAEACRRTHKPNAGRPIKWRECPPEKLEDYRTLRKFYTAAEARAMLEAV